MTKKRTNEKTILGLDPGLARLGFGIIKQTGVTLTYVSHGCLQTKPGPLEQRLEIINRQLVAIIKKYKPNLAVVEELFFGNNIKTAILVGQARGVIILTLGQQKISIRELTPLQVKQSLTGFGQASKNQIQQMVKALLQLKNIPEPDDAADALALAICGSQKNSFA